MGKMLDTLDLCGMDADILQINNRLLAASLVYSLLPNELIEMYSRFIERLLNINISNITDALIKVG